MNLDQAIDHQVRPAQIVGRERAGHGDHRANTGSYCRGDTGGSILNSDAFSG